MMMVLIIIIITAINALHVGLNVKIKENRKNFNATG